MGALVVAVVVVVMLVAGFLLHMWVVWERRRGAEVAAEHQLEHDASTLDVDAVRRLFPTLRTRSLSEGFRAPHLAGSPLLFKDTDTSREAYDTNDTSIDPVFASVIVDLGTEVPTVSLRRAGLAQRVAQRLGVDDVEVGSTEFDKAFVIKAVDAEAARRLLTPALMECLMRGLGSEIAMLQFRGQHALVTWKGFRYSSVGQRIEQASALVPSLRPRAR